MLPERSGLTTCGLPGIAQIAYGAHMCHFYQGRDDLAAALVPYFCAGLRSHQRCIWIAAQPLEAARARLELEKAGIDAGAELRKGSLVLRDYSDWYAEAGRLRGTQVVDLWLAAEEQALADGYEGLRITGNVTFLNARSWPGFMEYEALVDKAFQGRRIVTLCTYQRGACGASEVMDVVHRHGCTLERPDGGWQIVAGRPA